MNVENSPYRAARRGGPVNFLEPERNQQMKLSDVVVGGRYTAKVSGSLHVVRVTEPPRDELSS